MRHVCLALGLGILLGGCKKDDVVPAYMRERPHAVSRITIPGPFLPVLPRVPLVLTRCVNSYEELVGILGTVKIEASAVILDGGLAGDIRLDRSADLPGIWYTAVPGPTGSSLFNSQLMVEWRPDPSVFFSGFTADVWSAGCVYTSSNVGPFTNLMKDGVVIGINTCFFWSVGPYAGSLIKYIVL